MPCDWLKGKTPVERSFFFKRRLKRHKTIRFENDTETAFRTKKSALPLYLTSLTQDAAARAIDSFPLTNTNCVKSVELLQERFDQPHTRIMAYMQALLEFSRTSKSIRSLQAFYDNLGTYIRGL